MTKAWPCKIPRLESGQSKLLKLVFCWIHWIKLEVWKTLMVHLILIKFLEKAVFLVNSLRIFCNSWSFVLILTVCFGLQRLKKAQCLRKCWKGFVVLPVLHIIPHKSQTNSSISVTSTNFLKEKTRLWRCQLFAALNFILLHLFNR